jgi:hypothetical protein
MRVDWGIDAPVQLPPEEKDFEWTYPQQPLNQEHAAYLAMSAVHWGQRLIDLGRWLKEVEGPRFTERVNFLPFLAALVRYHPPLDRLDEFADYGGVSPIDCGPLARQRFLNTESKLMESLITTQPNADDIAAIWQWYCDTLLEKMDERLKPLGVDIYAIKTEIEKQEKLDEELKRELKEAPLHTSVSIIEGASVKDLRETVTRAAGQRQNDARKGGRPTRESLVAVQCAVLYDYHNGIHPQDSRRKKWTYKKLAEKFELPSPRAAEAHVQRGRELLEEA